MFENVPQHAQDWAQKQTLHVATAYSNPCRWANRRALLHDFRYHMEHTPCVKLHVGELALGDLPFEVTGSHEGDVQFRGHSILFHKENILNEVVKTFPPDWKYGAYIDGDFSFTRHDWALEAINKLQVHPFVQLFTSYTSLSSTQPGGRRPINDRVVNSFAYTYIKNGHKLPSNYLPGGWLSTTDSSQLAKPPAQWIPVGATGGAWAFTREAYETVGGLMDQCILGHGDWFMAFGLVSQPTQGEIAASKFHKNYTEMIEAWQDRANDLNKNIGVVDGYAVHHYHGPIKDRGYDTRDQILVKYQFDPVRDLRRNSYGIYELTNDKPAMRDAIIRYFYERNEDDPDL